MFMGLGMPIPDLSNKPGPGRPGWGPIGSYDFQFEVAGSDPVTIKANAAGAGNFRISWPNGTTQVLSGDNASITAPDATEGIVSINNEELDTTYADEFAVIGGQTAVTKVISWGQNAWSNMRNAFSGCTSLSDISTTSFTADSGCEMATMFNGCTSLLEADIKNWDLSAGVGWYGGSPFRNLANLRKLDMTGMNIKLTTRSDYAFASVGTAVTDGCEFLMSNIDWSTTTSAGIYTVYWFNSTIFKNTSNLSGWIFPSVGWNGTGTFLSSKIIGTNAIFNVSNWTTYSGSLFPRFTNFNSGLGNTGAKIDLTNFGMSNVNSMSTAFQATDVSEIVGLSTWGATAGSVNMQRAFWNSDHLSFLDNDNFSNTFIQSLTPTRVDQIFMSVGASSPNGVAPNISNIDLSNCTNFNQMLAYMQCNTVPAINTATFPSTAISLSSAFNRMRIQSNDETHLDFSNTTIKISNCNSMLDGAWIDKVTFGNNVDFSSLTIVNNMHRSMNLTNPNGTTTVLTYPTNADFSSLTNTSNWFASVSGPTTGPLTTCQVDNLIRRFRATAYGNALNVNFYQSQITEAPSVVRAQEAELVANGWTISENSTDATLPFAYASYTVDPTGITTISPTTTPPAGSVFTATNSLSIDSSTGVITINTFRGDSTIRCTYPDGCYNEVNMLIGVPMKMTFRMPVGSLSATVGYTNAVRTNEFVIDWDDGNLGDQSNNTHTYGSDGDYTVKVFKNYDPNMQNTSYLLSVDQWGDFNHYLGGYAFSGCLNVDVLATDSCILHGTSLANCFSGCDSLANTNNSIGNWDVSTITNMNSMFFGCDVFNADISQWVTTNVTDMGNMFMGAHYRGPYTIFNQDINTKLRSDGTLAWDTRNVITMNNMLRYNYSFDKDIGYWNTDKLENLGGFRSLFVGTFSWPNNDMSCKQVTLGTHTYIAWDTGNVTSFSSSFGGSINGGYANGISNWNTSSATSMNSMFGGGGTNDSSWDLSTRTVTVGTGATARTYTAWDTSLVTDMNGLFKSFANNNNAYIQGISNWNTQNVEDISRMFWLFPTANVNLNNWNTTNLENASQFLWGSRSNPPQMDQSFSNWNMTSFTGFFTGWVDYYQVPAYNSSISVANYDATLTSWGAQSVNSGVTTNMGDSQYSPGNVIYVNWNANNFSSGSNTLLTPGFNLQAATSVGDIIYYPASVGTTQTAYARITGYNSINEATTTTTNWPSSAGSVRAFEIYNSNAAKGRFALVEAGWNITDGGVYIPFDPTELEINVQAGDTMRVQFQTGTISTHIDWDDGNGYVAVNTTTADKTYTNAGTYTIRINETAADSFPGFNFASVTTAQKQMLTKIKKWGTNPYQKWYRAFYGCSNITSIDDTASPNLTSTTSLEWAFSLMQGLTTFDFSNWVFPATLVSFYRMFWRGNVISNASFNTIVNWDVSNITNFQATFEDCYLMNANISGWDTSSATNLSYMFSGASVFNQDISQWKTSNVTALAGMFNNAFAFNQDINTKVVGSGASAYIAWDTSNNTSWNGMFKDATAFNQPIDKWEIAQVSDSFGMTFMFGRTCGFNQDLLTKDVTIGAGTPVAKTYVAWDVSYIQTFGMQYYSNLPSMHGMFESNTVFNGDISNWDIPSTNARSDGKILNRMFLGTTVFNGDISEKTITNVTGKGTYNAWDISSATELNSTFNSAVAFNQNLSDWRLNISATNFDNIFRNNSNVGISTNNYTDTIVGWANYVKNQNPDAPLNVLMRNQYGKNFESARSGGANFANAAAARTFLTDTVANGGAGWTINGDNVIPIPVTPLKLKVTTTSANQSFIYRAGAGSNYHIDWDDGNGFVGPYTTAQTKTYTNAGSYIIQVGQSNDTVNVAYDYGYNSSTNLIEEIQQWPEGLNTNLFNFQHRTNSTALEITATNIPEFSAGANLQKCFANISAIVDNGDNLSKWNLDNVTNMNQFFDSSSIPNTLDTNTKQVTYNGLTYIAWDVKSLTNAGIGRGNMPIGTNWNINSMTSLKYLSGGKNNTDLDRKQITVGTGATQRTYNQWDSENATQYQTLDNEYPNMILDSSFNNHSIKNWIFNYTLSNSSSYLFFSYQAAWGANSSNDNYTNCWIGWAIGIKNGWVSEKGSNYTADYLTNFSINMHTSFNLKMNSSLSIDSNIHSNIPTGWTTAADALEYLTSTQGWTIPYT